MKNTILFRWRNTKKKFIPNGKTTFHSVDVKNNGLFGKEDVIANRFLQKLYQAEQSKQPFFFSLFSTIYRINTDGFGKHFCGFSGRFYPQLFGKEAEIANRFCKSCIWIGWHLHHTHDDGP